MTSDKEVDVASTLHQTKDTYRHWSESPWASPHAPNCPKRTRSFGHPSVQCPRSSPRRLIHRRTTIEIHPPTHSSKSGGSNTTTPSTFWCPCCSVKHKENKTGSTTQYDQFFNRSVPRNTQKNTSIDTSVTQACSIEGASAQEFYFLNLPSTAVVKMLVVTRSVSQTNGQFVRGVGAV